MISSCLLALKNFSPGELPLNSFSKHKIKQNQEYCHMANEGLLYGRTCSSIENGCSTRSKRKIKEDAHILTSILKYLKVANLSEKYYYSHLKI